MRVFQYSFWLKLHNNSPVFKTMIGRGAANNDRSARLPCGGDIQPVFRHPLLQLCGVGQCLPYYGERGSNIYGIYQ